MIRYPVWQPWQPVSLSDLLACVLSSSLCGYGRSQKKTRQVPNVLIGLNVFVHWLWEVAMCGLPDTGFRRVLFSGAIGKYLLQKHQGSKVLTPRDFALGWCQPVILCTKVSPFEALTPRCTIRHQNA